MARKKKKAEQEGISAGWINTFADLMNLLLCFFVLLFSMSTVDADKYEQLVTSMTERINIFDGGGAAVGTAVSGLYRPGCAAEPALRRGGGAL